MSDTLDIFIGAKTYQLHYPHTWIALHRDCTGIMKWGQSFLMAKDMHRLAFLEINIVDW